MKSTKRMLLGVIIALLGLGFAQPGNNYFLFRSFIFLPLESITTFFPLLSIVVIFIGVIIGFVGFFEKNQVE